MSASDNLFRTLSRVGRFGGIPADPFTEDPAYLDTTGPFIS